jgi:adenine-specific DNA-methyltransferase
MVQLDEPTDLKSDAFKHGYKNLCEIGRERINRAGDSIIKEANNTQLDIGYKVFKLDSSNVKPWDPNLEDLEQGMLEQLENVKEDRTREDLLFEVLLKIGIPLTTPIEEISYEGKVIHNVAFGSVLLCLEDVIDIDIVNEMIKLKQEDFEPKVIFKESGFLSDSVKTNAIQTLKKNGITDVRSV